MRSNGNGFGTINLSQLFQAAEDEGTLSPAARAVLDVPDLGAQIQAGLGVKVDDVESSEVVLVTIMPDDSGSIRFAGNAAAVRDGHNAVLDALCGSKQKDSILSHTRYLNGKVLHPYCQVAHAERMTAANYDPNLGTPLHDQTVVLLGTVLAKAQEFAGAGVPVRTVTLLITDGADEHSVRAKAADVAAVVRDMAAQENHIVAAMGIDDGQTKFRDVFRAMGIEDRWILTPKNDPGEIRRAFLLFSQSAVRASQGGAAFSRAAAGGFAGP
ncbi:MAG: hypothetical protein QM820_41195 [Minicystis sp.]